MSDGEAHARLAPSSAGRWAHCPGSVRMEELVPELPDAEDTGKEGTAAHWVAAEVLNSMLTDAPHSAAKYLGATAPNGAIITLEMVEAVDVYTNHVLGITTAGVRPRIEMGVRMRCVHPEHAWGTADAVVADGVNSVLYIRDFKYGWGLVEPRGNKQLLLYAIGALEEIHAAGNPVPEHLDLGIVQPRPYHPIGKVRTWRLPMSELNAYVAELATAATEAMGANPRTIVGSDACKHCPARHDCPALNAAVNDVLQWVDAAQPMNLNGPQIGKQLTELKMAQELLNARITGLEAQAAAIIKSGKPVNGWSLRPGQRRTVWDKPVDEVIAFGALMGADLSKPGAITPKQAEALLKSMALGKEVVAALAGYSKVEGSGLKLVPAEKDNKLAKEIFSHD